jgi:hypothetical protein
VVLVAFVRAVFGLWGRQQGTEIRQTPYAVMPQIGNTLLADSSKKLLQPTF